MTHYSLGIVDKPTSGADPTIIYFYDPLNDGALPGGSTFTRGTVAEEYDGTDFTELSSGTIREDSVANVSGAKGYLSEPAATNEIRESNDYNSLWLLQRITATDLGVSGIGLQTHDIDAGTLANNHRLLDQVGSLGLSWAMSFVADASTNGQYFALRPAGGSGFSVFDLVNGTITETGSEIDYDGIIDLGSGYYRGISIDDDLINETPLLAIANSATPGQADPGFVGNNESFNLAHVQAEGTTYYTSPIITSGSSVTRVADVLDTNVTIASEFSCLLDLTLPTVIGAGNTITLIGPDATSEDILRVDATFNVIMDDGGTPVTIGTSSAGARIKVAYGRDSGDRSGSLDGATAVDGDAPGSGHEGDTFQLGCANSVNQSRCIHHTSTLFNVKKSDAELESLAT